MKYAVIQGGRPGKVFFMEGAFIPILVFLAVYAAITFELVNKAVAALLGVMVLLMLHIIGEHEAAAMIDFETIMLLLGMMTIVAILRRSGVFSVLSFKIAELTQGNPLKILILFSIITALMSAFLDNVTTVLIIIPIIIELTNGMGLDPKIYVISQAVISNIGGTATLIGDPPNIIIGSKVGLTFNQFITNLTLPVVITFAITILYIWLTNRDKFRPVNTSMTKLFNIQLLLEKIYTEFVNTHIDKKLMIKGCVCLGIAILLFVTQTFTKISPGVVAVFIAMILLAISGVEVEHMLEEVEWSTLLFFSGLFILVGVLEHKGVIEWVAHNVFLRIGDNPYVMTLTVLWVSGIVSGFLDNIPFTITMIPIVRLMLETTPIPNDILWWALSLGACFGGNLTMIGASANIVSLGIANQSKVQISFLEFMKVGAMVTFISLIICSIFLTLFLWISL